jgi:hypothetical protein
VPGLTGIDFFRAKEPANARTGTITQYRPMKMQRPMAVA